MTNDGSNTLVYDGENRALSATNGSTSGTYAYDGNGLRVTKVAGGTTTVYIFAGSKVIAEYDNGATVASPSREYIYSRAQLLAKIESGATTYFHADHLSARLLTDLSGNTLGQRGHYPFGETWYETGTTTKFKFTTYERDGESGNDYAMARFNINRLGRFSSPDPIAGSIGDPQSLNRYTYVKNYPIGFVDPSGLDCTYVSAQESQPCTVGGGIWGFSGSDFGLTGGGQPHVSLLECHVDPYCISNGGIGRFGSPVANGYSWADSTYTAGGNYRIQRPKGALVLNCEGSASDLDCFWATWSLQYVINGNQRYVGANLSNPDELRIRAIGQQTVKRVQQSTVVLRRWAMRHSDSILSTLQTSQKESEHFWMIYLLSHHCRV